MREIIYRETKELPQEALGSLFLSVEWDSAKYPSRLVKAVAGSDTVITAWSGGELVGLVNAIDDGELTAYVHYLLVNPAFQGLGVGKELMRRIACQYAGYLYTIVIAETQALTGFYQKLGFSAEPGHVAMTRMNYENQV